MNEQGEVSEISTVREAEVGECRSELNLLSPKK